MNQPTKKSPRRPILAGVLALTYAALMALAFYLESARIEDYWPTWLLWLGGTTGFATLLVLPFLVVKHLLGIDVSPLWKSFRRFSLRGMLIGVAWISVFVFYFAQMEWGIQRSFWRTTNSATARFTPGPAPIALRLIGELGESRIEIENATEEQIAEAKRLFPEATVVAVPNLGRGGAGGE